MGKLNAHFPITNISHVRRVINAGVVSWGCKPEPSEFSKTIFWPVRKLSTNCGLRPKCILHTFVHYRECLTGTGPFRTGRGDLTLAVISAFEG